MKDTTVWDKWAPVYAAGMTIGNDNAYRFLYHRIRKVIKGKRVLEIATGPGMIAKHVASVAESMVATDFSVKMLQQARKGRNPKKLKYQYADAHRLPFPDASFEVVIMANALHVMPDPEKALSEIRRVLVPAGILIAPNYIHDSGGGGSHFVGEALKHMGVSFESSWDAKGYKKFLEYNGFFVVNAKVLPAMIPMMYVETVKN